MIITAKVNLYGEEQEITADESVICYLRVALINASEMNMHNGYEYTAKAEMKVSQELHKALIASGYTD